VIAFVCRPTLDFSLDHCHHELASDSPIFTLLRFDSCFSGDFDTLCLACSRHSNLALFVPACYWFKSCLAGILGTLAMNGLSSRACTARSRSLKTTRDRLGFTKGCQLHRYLSTLPEPCLGMLKGIVGSPAGKYLPFPPGFQRTCKVRP